MSLSFSRAKVWWLIYWAGRICFYFFIFKTESRRLVADLFVLNPARLRLVCFRKDFCLRCDLLYFDARAWLHERCLPFLIDPNSLFKLFVCWIADQFSVPCMWWPWTDPPNLLCHQFRRKIAVGRLLIFNFSCCRTCDVWLVQLTCCARFILFSRSLTSFLFFIGLEQIILKIVGSGKYANPKFLVNLWLGIAADLQRTICGTPYRIPKEQLCRFVKSHASAWGSLSM
jgi:hypothetical protein